MSSVPTLVVIPAHNEVDTVGQVVRRVAAVGFPVLVVDDGSSDGTASAAMNAGATVVTMPVNLGVGGAMRAGFKYAVQHDYRRVVQVDADLQHPPEAIPTLIDAADDGVDLVIGSRFAEGYETEGYRRTAMRAVAAIVSRMVGVHLDDVTSGFRVVTEPLLSRFADRYPAEYLGDTVESLLQAHTSGATIAQVSVPMEQRAEGAATSRVAAGGHLARLAVAVVAGKPQRMGR
ncbi:MAG: glycosyltransferase family 2 protein [Actinomycetota bacterium]|nr:glycosyltransferase family 2 protein [Actinomycetota bacterium]